MSPSFNRRLAVFVGAFCVLGETVRRWSTWREWPPSFFDDYLIGAFLFYGAWRAGRDAREGQRYLAAAWGFAAAFGYASFFGHLREFHASDPAPIPHEWLTALIGAGFLLCLWALSESLRPLKEDA
ncbi:MAG TPA: hypothetical protein VFS10_01685 [Pyrinomonadaceae bacterium]|nr:hypothetical protein [Pyrinomonadaceae bacterium]